MDNASTNDTLMEYIEENLKDKGIVYDPRQSGLDVMVILLTWLFAHFFWEIIQMLKDKLMELLSHKLAYRFKS